MKGSRIIRVFLIFSILFSLYVPPTSAFDREVFDFDRIYYYDGDFHKTGDPSQLILAVTYTNATVDDPNFREIDYCQITFYQDPFYFRIYFEDEISVDPEGNPNEPADGYVYLKKSIVDNYLPDSIKELASKSFSYSTITFQGVQWYRVYCPDFNREYVWKRFTEPSLDETWFTWGSNESIKFNSRAMNIKQTKKVFNSNIEFEITHDSNTDGQEVYVNKTWLQEQGITDPQFVLGNKKPWDPIMFHETDDYYILYPQHFSAIGIYQSATGTTVGGFCEVDDDFYAMALHYDKDYFLNDLPNYEQFDHITLARLTKNKILVSWTYYVSLRYDVYARVVRVSFDELGRPIEFIRGDQLKLSSGRGQNSYDPFGSLMAAGFTDEEYDKYAIVAWHEKRIKLDSDWSERGYCDMVVVKNGGGYSNTTLEIYVSKKNLVDTTTVIRVYNVNFDIDVINKDHVALCWSYLRMNLYGTQSLYPGSQKAWFYIIDKDGSTNLHTVSDTLFSDYCGAGYSRTHSSFAVAVNKGAPDSEAYALFGMEGEGHVDCDYDNGRWINEVIRVDGTVTDINEWKKEAPYGYWEWPDIDDIYISPVDIDHNIADVRGRTNDFSGRVFSAGGQMDGTMTIEDGVMVSVERSSLSGFESAMIVIDEESDWGQYSDGCRLYFGEGTVGEYIDDVEEGYSYHDGNPKITGTTSMVMDDNLLFVVESDGVGNYIYPVGIGGIGDVNISRSSGAFENNEITATAETYIDENGALWIPVGELTTGVMNFTDNNNPGMGYTEVFSKSVLDAFGEYYYDQNEHAVYIYLDNVSEDDSFDYTINLTQDSDFYVYPPNYLRSGDNFCCRGMIADAEGDPVDDVVATTTIYGNGYRDDTFYSKTNTVNFSSSFCNWIPTDSYQFDRLGVFSRNASYYSWNDTNLSYRKLIRINSNSEYAGGGNVSINLTYVPGMNNSFKDLRFTNLTGTSYAYQIINETNDSYANIRINITDAISVGMQLIGYMYYGNDTYVNDSSTVSAVTITDAIISFDNAENFSTAPTNVSIVGYVNNTLYYLDGNGVKVKLESFSYSATPHEVNGNITYLVAFGNDSYTEYSDDSKVVTVPADTTEIHFAIKIQSDAWNESDYSYSPYIEKITFDIDTVKYLAPNTPIMASKWNCSHGNFECDMATTPLMPGIYAWEISFLDLGSSITFKHSGPLYLDTYSGGGGGQGGGPFANAYLYYTFFDLNTGTQLGDDYFKFYISPDTTFNTGDRTKGGVRPTYLGQTLYFKITDYFNNKVYPLNASYSSVFIDDAETYIDVGINLRQFRVKNMNDSVIFFILRDNETDQQLGRWIPPYEETEFFLLDNIYNLTIQYYDPATAMLEQTVYIENFEVSSDTFYLIPGYSLADIIIVVNNVNDSILNQIINVGVYVNNINSTVFQQELNSNTVLNNINSNISLQHANIVTTINNVKTNITQQVNSVWFAVNNTNSSINQQANLIKQTIENHESNITTQINAVLQNVTNVNSTVLNQANGVLQQINNVETNISTQVNGVWQTINDTNSTIHVQLNTVEQTVVNINTNLTTQANLILQNITNLGDTIGVQLTSVNQNVLNANNSINTQLNLMTSDINNMNNSIQVQLNSVSQEINNFRTNITSQVNSVWASVNNSNSSILYQLNVISANITNHNTSINTQLNFISSSITNTEANITNQLNNIEVRIENTETNLTNEINAINVSIVNNNTEILNQLNAVLVNISNTNSTVVNQANMIVNTISNTETNITNQLNAVETMISNTESNITAQVSIVLTQIQNTETNITTQVNVMQNKITNIDNNITTQFNYVEVQIQNTETNITNQINSINTTILNVNGSIQTQLNAIITKIENSNMSMIDQINLVWNEINNTNTTIWTQINGVNTKITTMWSDVNYSFSVIQSDIFYTNTTIVNLITDLNATLLAKLTNVLDNVSQAGMSVFDKVVTVLDNLANINTSLHDEIILQAINIMNSVHQNTSMAYNVTLAILENVSNINMSINGSAILEILNLTQQLQQQIVDSFSYINTRLDNITDIIEGSFNLIFNELQSVNITGFDELMNALLDILEQFELPHEWMIPDINYSINDTMPPVSTISAVSALGGGISVRWVSSDNWGVAYTTIYYRVANGTWKIWKPATIPAGSDTFKITDVTLVNGTVYWFMCLGVDHAGNVEDESDKNVCNVTYALITVTPPNYGDINNMLSAATLNNIYFWIIIGILLMILLILGKSRKAIGKRRLQRELRHKRPIYYEEEL